MGPIYNHCLFNTAYKMPYFVLQGYVTVKCRYFFEGTSFVVSSHTHGVPI